MTSALRVLVVVIALVAAAAPAPAAGDGDALLGAWLTEPDEVDGRARVEIVKVGEHYEGTIVWLEKPIYPQDDEQGMAGQTKVDRENPDAALRSRPVIGLKILTELQWDAGRGEWRKGRIYAPDDGKTYRCYIRMGDDGTLKLRGYVGIALLGRTSEWTRAPEAEAAGG